MRKITSLMLMLLCAVTTFACTLGDYITSLESLTEGTYVSFKNVGRNKYIYEADDKKMSHGDAANSLAYVWQVHKEGDYYSFSSITGYYISTPIDAQDVFTVAADDKRKDKFAITVHGENNEKWKLQSTNNANIYWDGQVARFVGWQGSGANSQFEIIPVEVSDDEITGFFNDKIAPIKATAKTEVETLAKVNVLFADATELLDLINNASPKNADEYYAAVEAINSAVLAYKKSVDGKNIKLCNKGSDGRNGKYLGYDNANSRAAAVASGGDDVIWTIQSNEDGTFKLYNFVNDLYLGAPADPTPVVKEANNAPSFKIIPTGDNVVAVVCTNGDMVHVANHTNYKLISYYSLTDGASLWNVTAVPAIVATHEEIAAANAAKASLPYAIQEAYGLVTKAENYYSNYKSDAEGSYEALLDNVESTYFHSAYGSESGDGSGVHYIQANLGAGNSVDEFYFYMKPRSGNGNNRPVNITVAGSNDNLEYTKIADVTTTLDGTMTPYLSAKLGTDGTNYQYIRLTVTSTNTNTTFFTLSELYFFPATSDVENLVNAYSGLATTSITSNDYATYANALVNAEATLALANIKKEIAVLIEANMNNHKEVPALGEYSTAGYNAFVTAYNDASATQESLENAITAFKKAKNSPVFTISGKKDYVVGKSLYEDEGNTNGKGNDCYFKTTNKYDKTMWWVFDQTSTTVGVTESVAVMNYTTGNPIWGVENLKITETVPAIADDGVFLFYSVGNNTPLHFQQDGSLLTRWSSYAADTGSAATFTYVGNTYELDKMTDAHIVALSELQAAYDSKASFVNAEIGEGLGQYTGSKDALVSAVVAAKSIVEATMNQQAVMEVANIEAAATAINEGAAALVLNMPVEGKYYRIQGACEASPANHYITGHTNADGGRIALTAEADASTIFYFTNGNLVAYQSGLVIGLSQSHWTFASIDDNSKPASTIAFEASPRTVGAYLVKSADLYMHYKTHEGAAEIDRCSSDGGHANHDWYLTEVKSLPVTITKAGYATFYAPVAVGVPENVTAHTVTINGDWATLSEIEGDVIPANTGVVLEAAEGNYDFTITTAAEFDGVNALLGTVAATNIADDAYVLGYINVAEEGEDAQMEVGFYTASMTNGAWKNNSHKAYLPKAVNSNSASLRFGFGTTAIEEVETENAGAEVIFDLTGRRVNQITKAGVYIVNGKKTLVK